MSGSLWLKPPKAGAPLPAIPRPRRTGPAERPAPPPPPEDDGLAADPVDELARRLDGFVAVAVHPDEIAALLESDGMNDEHIRLTYGRADSFSLAEDLYARVERRHPEPAAPPAGAWYGELAGCLLRGLVFALPGLAYVLAAPLLAGAHGRFGLPAGTVPLLAGAVTGWVWNQALSHRAYTWLGLGDRPAAARALLGGAPAGGAGGGGVGHASAGAGASPPAVGAAGAAPAPPPPAPGAAPPGRGPAGGPRRPGGSRAGAPPGPPSSPPDSRSTSPPRPSSWSSAANGPCSAPCCRSPAPSPPSAGTCRTPCA
ncbi:hypothetical protein ACFWWN_25330 [Streptomyces sp. NPDC059082]|uniref:hypothetical protein n=1 Tax=Streptomyces sp. NPDC059082 TaxID=3346720 RepID=UPI0036A23B95